MSGICDTCKRNQDCRKPLGGIDYCRLYIRGKESNYTRLFGTPERAARTLATTAKCIEPAATCRNCMYMSYCNTQCDYASLLDLLKGDA